MDDKYTKQMLDQLADLYLTGTDAVPEVVADSMVQLDAPAPIKMSPKINETQGLGEFDAGDFQVGLGGVAEGLALVGEMEDPYRLKFDDGVNELDEVSSGMKEMASRRVEMVVAGNLPGYADGWISQYANHVAQERGLVLMLHVDEQHIDLDVFAPVGYDLTGMTDLHNESGGPLTEVLSGVLNDRQHWIECVLIHNACGEIERREEVRDGLNRCVLLSGCDVPAQMAGVKLLGDLYEKNRAGVLEVVLMGKMTSGPDEVLDLINAGLRDRLGSEAGLGGSLQQMQPVNRALIASFGNDPSQWGLVRHIVKAVEGADSRAQVIDIAEDINNGVVDMGQSGDAVSVVEDGALFDEAARITAEAKTNQAEVLRDFGVSVSALDDLLSKKVLLDSELMAMAQGNRVDRSEGIRMLNLKDGKVIADKQLEPTIVADGLKRGLAEMSKGFDEVTDIEVGGVEKIERVVEVEAEEFEVKVEAIAETEERAEIFTETVIAQANEPVAVSAEPAVSVVPNVSYVEEDEVDAAAEMLANFGQQQAVGAGQKLGADQIDEIAEAVKQKLAGSESVIEVVSNSSYKQELCLARMLDMSDTLAGKGIVLDAKCPDFEHVDLCLDEAGGLHLLCHQDEIESVDGVLMQLLEVKGWVEKHWALISLTQKQLRFDKSVQPRVHVFTNQGIAGTQLIGRMGESLKMHLLQEVKIGSESTWVCNDLN